MGHRGFVLIIINKNKQLWIFNRFGTRKEELGVKLIDQLISYLQELTVEELRDEFDELNVIHEDPTEEETDIIRKWSEITTFEDIIGTGHAFSYCKPKSYGEFEHEVVFMEDNYILDFEKQEFSHCDHSKKKKRDMREYISHLMRHGRERTMKFDTCSLNIDSLEEHKRKWDIAPAREQLKEMKRKLAKTLNVEQYGDHLQDHPQLVIDMITKEVHKSVKKIKMDMNNNNNDSEPQSDTEKKAVIKVSLPKPGDVPPGNGRKSMNQIIEEYKIKKAQEDAIKKIEEEEHEKKVDEMFQMGLERLRGMEEEEKIIKKEREQVEKQKERKKCTCYDHPDIEKAFNNPQEVIVHSFVEGASYTQDGLERCDCCKIYYICDQRRGFSLHTSRKWLCEECFGNRL